MVGICVGQFISSLPSVQSSAPLHFAARGKHCSTYAHVNWSLLQVGGCGSADPTRTKVIFVDSLLSVVMYTAFEMYIGTAGKAADFDYKTLKKK